MRKLAFWSFYTGGMIAILLGVISPGHCEQNATVELQMIPFRDETSGLCFMNFQMQFEIQDVDQTGNGCQLLRIYNWNNELLYQEGYDTSGGAKGTMMDMVYLKAIDIGPLDSSNKLAVPASASYKIKVSIGIYANGTIERNFYRYVDVNDIASDDDGPPEIEDPDPDDPNNWWHWITGLFTPDGDKLDALEAMVERFKAAGPWGDISEVISGYDQRPETIPDYQGFPQVFTFPMEGARATSGDTQTRVHFHLQDMPLPMSDLNAITTGSPGDDGQTPWLHIPGTFEGKFTQWIGIFRTFLKWTLWALFSIGLVHWAKGKVSV